jgi:Holliday junction resolvase
MGQEPGGLPVLKPKCGGLSPKRKGYEYERATVNFMRDGGLECRRVPLSGAGDEKGDVCVTSGFGTVYRGELKRRKNLPEWITGALGTHDFMAMRGDRGESLVVIRASLFRDLLQ